MKKTETDSEILREIGKSADPDRLRNRDRLRVRIYDELRKADESVDCDLIAENIRTLHLLDGQEYDSGADTAAVVRAVRKRAVSSRPRWKRLLRGKLFRPALAACAALVVLAGVNTAVARATGNGIVDHIVRYGKDYIGFNFRDSQSSAQAETTGSSDGVSLSASLRQQCENAGLSILLPAKFPADFRQTQFQPQDIGDIGKSVSIAVGDKKDTVVISVRTYIDQAYLPSVKTPGATDLTRLNIGGLTVYMVREGSHYVSVFSDGNTVYTISSSLGKSQTVDMLNSLR